MESSSKKLRTGFTTGTCATAAAKAALLAIINEKNIQTVNVKIPNQKYINIKIEKCYFEKIHAKCSVIKDGGDDPDVTHGAEIIVDLELTDKQNEIEIIGGYGVGIVTKQGLGLELNKHAINPVPKKMIRENLMEIGKMILQKNGIKITISVPTGKKLGPKTDNPRLGIIGGISILGTSGIVVPFSTASYAASIRQSLDVSVAAGDMTVILTTGGRSEEFAKKIIDGPDHCFVQMGDFSGYTIQQCAKKGIKKAYVVGFIGKLAKMAAGIKQTHVKGSKVNMKFLAQLATQCNANESVVSEILQANTARHVSEIINAHKIMGFFELVCDNVYKHMRGFSNEKVIIGVILFDFDGTILAKK